MTTTREAIEQLNSGVSMNQRAWLINYAVKVFPNLDTGLLWNVTEFLTTKKYNQIVSLLFKSKDWLARQKLQRELETLMS